MSVKNQIETLHKALPEKITLVAVSKTYPARDIMEAYDAGQRIFGENRPQELRDKYHELPRDIRWHMIGHLQTNKVKYIAPFVELIHSVDSGKLLEEINSQALKNQRTIDVLFEVRIAREDTKYGWDKEELTSFISSGSLATYKNIRVRGLMGMATFTDDTAILKEEFTLLKNYFDKIKMHFFPEDPGFDTLSMGMTSDYELAIECGSNMVRIGSLIFGERKYY